MGSRRSHTQLQTTAVLLHALVTLNLSDLAYKQKAN